MNIKFTLLLSASVALTSSSAFGADIGSVTLLHQALAAQGGEDKLRGLRNVQWEASGYQNAVDQSVRPEGPYFTSFETVAEMHDLSGNRYRNTTETVLYPVFRSSLQTVLSDNILMYTAAGHNRPGTAEQANAIRERLALSPERLLLTALDAPDTHTEPDTLLQSVRQNVVVFTLDHAPVRIYLNAYTHLPTAVDYSGPLAHEGAWAFLGDVTMRTYYGFWWLAKNGIHFPLQWNIEGNGSPSEMLVVSSLRIDDSLDQAQFAIPADVRMKFQPDAPARSLEDVPLGIPGQPTQELAPGIVSIPGAWNVTIVRQDDGLVILEAPIASGYSAKVIAEAHRRFPGERIKAVITTSDSWPHLAGIREYAANGIPIYGLDLNRPILERFLADPRRTKPDALALNPRKAELHFIREKTVLGAGANRVEIYPVRGQTAERQMIVYFPEQHLLYGSDMFQGRPDGTYFYPQEVTELMDVVAREHLQVERFFMMHVGATPWSDLAKAVASANAEDSPTKIK